MTEVVTQPAGMGSVVVSGKHSGEYVYANRGDGCQDERDHGRHAVEAAHRVAVQLGAATQTLSAQSGNETFGLSRQLGHIESNILNNLNQRIFDTNVNIEKTAAATNLAIERTAAAAALAHCQNAAALQAAIAACCCDVKELIRAEADKTRETVRDIELHRTQTELADLKMAALLAKAK